jgi:hypothetical protein
MKTFAFSIEMYGTNLHRLFEGSAVINDGDANVAIALAGMLTHIVANNSCAEATSITATIRDATPYEKPNIIQFIPLRSPLPPCPLCPHSFIHPLNPEP